VGCCHDNPVASCPAIGGVDAANQIACCRPEPARVEGDVIFPTQPRDCYNPAFQSCCKAQYNHDYGNGTYRIIGSAAPFDSEMQQCCSTGTSQPSYVGVSGFVNTASRVIVPKAVASCVQYLRKQTPATAATQFRCLTDNMCPGYRATGENRGKCCRRPIAFGELPANYDLNGAGVCYDPKYEGCCEARLGDVDLSQTAQANSTAIYDLMSEKCCKLPATNLGAPGLQTYIVSVYATCPCLLDADCPTANYTCCAPSQAQLQGGDGNTRRLVQCAGAAGAATNNSNQGPLFDGTASRFPGCYGKCVSTGGASAPNEYTQACLNSIPTFADQCKDLRVANPNAWSVNNNNGDVDTILTGIQWKTPAADDLIVAEWDLHNKDCCKNENGFSVGYDVTTEFCCPVIGTAPPSGGLPRRLTPVVPRSSMNDDNFPTSNGATWGGCLCAADADCQTGFKCCENGNSYLLQNHPNALKARQLTYTRPDGTVLNGVCINANTTDCCKADRVNPDTARYASAGSKTAIPYNPSESVCCASGWVAPSLNECGCHTNADCPGEFGTCCTANTQFGSGTHAAGVCYDSRTAKCCQYHTRSNAKPIASSPALLLADVYDDSNQYCCPWGGPMANLNTCPCRSDGAEADCGKDLKCCAGLISTKTANNTQYRNGGHCYDPKMNQGCCQSKTTTVPARTAVEIYDTQREVCCTVNGRAADHRWCMCSSDAHCPANGECCIDAEWKAAGARIDCSDWTGGHCPGRCIHKEIETCCDKPYTSEWKQNHQVATCVKDYQKCCEGECCNKATQTCKKTTKNRGRLTGTFLSSVVGTVQGGTNDAVTAGYHYGLDEDAKACTTIEHSSPSIVFHTWVFPAFLSVACIIVVLLGSRAGLSADFGGNMHRLALVGIQVFVAVLAILLLWSPLWKYGFGVVFANSFILHSFVVGGQWARRFACILLVVTFLWVYEPFGTNVILSFGTVTFRGENDAFAAGQPIHGLNYAARMLQRSREDVSGNDACTQFYMYWKTDSELHDHRTWNPAGATRGICRRSWMHTIVVLAGILTPFEAIWLFLAAVALARASQATKDVKVQPIQA